MQHPQAPAQAGSTHVHGCSRSPPRCGTGGGLFHSWLCGAGVVSAAPISALLRPLASRGSRGVRGGGRHQRKPARSPAKSAAAIGPAAVTSRPNGASIGGWPVARSPLVIFQPRGPAGSGGGGGGVRLGGPTSAQRVVPAGGQGRTQAATGESCDVTDRRGRMWH